MLSQMTGRNHCEPHSSWSHGLKIPGVTGLTSSTSHNLQTSGPLFVVCVGTVVSPVCRVLFCAAKCWVLLLPCVPCHVLWVSVCTCSCMCVLVSRASLCMCVCVCRVFCVLRPSGPLSPLYVGSDMCLGRCVTCCDLWTAIRSREPPHSLPVQVTTAKCKPVLTLPEHGRYVHSIL